MTGAVGEGVRVGRLVTSHTQVGVIEGVGLGVCVLDAVGVNVLVDVLVGEAVGVRVGGGNVRVGGDSGNVFVASGGGGSQGGCPAKPQVGPGVGVHCMPVAGSKHSDWA